MKDVDDRKAKFARVLILFNFIKKYPKAMSQKLRF